MILPAQIIRSYCAHGDKSDVIYPFYERIVDVESGMSYGLSSAGYDVRIAQSVMVPPSDFVLASTVEHFRFPTHLIGFVHDKSTWARKGLAVQNTVLEPGWYGYLTLELSNHGKEPIYIAGHTPIAQIIFQGLLEPTWQPYTGKYQNQEDRPVEAKFER